jgi:hypothetical protein
MKVLFYIVNSIAILITLLIVSGFVIYLSNDKRNKEIS